MMVSTLKIGVAEDDFDMREFYQIVIPELGHRLLWVVQNGVELIEFTNRALPDLDQFNHRSHRAMVARLIRTGKSPGLTTTQDFTCHCCAGPATKMKSRIESEYLARLKQNSTF